MNKQELEESHRRMARALSKRLKELTDCKRAVKLNKKRVLAYTKSCHELDAEIAKLKADYSKLINECFKACSYTNTARNVALLINDFRDEHDV